MSINLEKFSNTAGLNFFAKQACHAADRLTELTFHVLDGATTSLGRLLPDLRPRSVGDVVLQTKQKGSALFGTPGGDVLIEISQDQKGYYIFKAVGETLEPIVIYEGKKKTSGAAWEVKVSTYVQQVVKLADSVSYGETARRWKGETFTALKEKFVADGLLRKRGGEVLLKLPGEDLLTFDGAQASLKAEIVLKRFYQRRKTEVEEIQSRPWELLNNLFVGYLYFSGYALAPWVDDHVMLPHQRAEMEDEKARRMTADGFLDNHELTEMAKHPGLRDRVISIAEAEADAGDGKLLSQLDNVTFQPDGYSQTFKYEGKSYAEQHVFAGENEAHSLMVCPEKGFCEEFITEQTPTNLIYTQKRHDFDKIHVQKATFTKEGAEWKLTTQENYEEGRVLRLPDRSFASTILDQSHQLVAHAAKIYLATMITQQSRKMALIGSLFHLVSQTKAASVPEARHVNAVRLDSMMKRRAAITVITPLPYLTATVGVPFVEQINLPTYYQLSIPNDNLDLSITQANGSAAPSWLSMNMGDLSLIKSMYLTSHSRDVFVSGNYAYIAGDTSFQMVDISNPGSPIVVGSYTNPRIGGELGGFVFVKGNYAYYGDIFFENFGTGVAIHVLDVSNPASISSQATFYNAMISHAMTQSGNYIFIGQYDSSASNDTLTIIDITNPINPFQVSSISWPTLGGSITDINIYNNYAYVSDYYYLCIVDISNPSNPALVRTISINALGGWVTATLARDNFLFVTAGPSLQIYNNTQISNPVLVSTVYLGPQATTHYATANSMILEGNYLYVFCYEQGLKVVNVEDPLNPSLVTTFNTVGSAVNGFLSQNNVFVADDLAGLTIINTQQRKLSGTPTVADRGLLLLDATAADGLGNTVVEPVAIHIGSISITTIPNQQVYVGSSMLFTLPAGTFEYPGATFTYTATLVGGAPLPLCINFDSGTRTFIFAPQSGDQNTYRIQVAVDDGYGGTSSTTFDLSVPDRYPVVAQPLANQTAYTGTPFVYAFTSNSFTDADNDLLSYSARLVGSSSGLPGWLNFDPVLRQFYGTPFGRGVYPIQVTANDENGGVVSNTFTITVPSSPPVVINPIGTQTVGAGIAFSYTFNSNTFYDVDNDPLTYSTGTLPAFLAFNPATRTFSGVPHSVDIGTYTITLQAQATGGNVSTTFSLSVLSSTNSNPPVLIEQIPDLSITSGIPFNKTISSKTFEDPQHLNLTYTATLEGGNPLPYGLDFNANTLTLSGTVPTPQTMRITIKAADVYGAFAIDTFTLTVMDGTKYPPIVLNPLPDVPATVGTPFFMEVPQNTFKDLNGDQLIVSVEQSGGLPLPGWLKWDAAKFSFSGTPGHFDTNTYSNRQVTINVWAKDNVGSVKTSFIISVGGESFWALFIKYGFSFASAGVSAYGLWKQRALIWNYLCKNKYQKPIERAIVGQDYNRDMQLEHKKIKEVRAYSGDEPLPQQQLLPDGLSYEYGAISGTPTAKDLGLFTVRVFDYDGYINEEFYLIIKNDSTDPDPEKQPSCFIAAQAKLSQMRTLFHSSREHNEELGVGCLGRLKKHLPTEFPMRKLSNTHDDTKS